MTSGIRSKTEAYDFFNNILRKPRYIVAPMVDHSELSYRMLTRKYGADLCYTQMLNSNMFEHRSDLFETCAEDRPLIVQFAGHDPNQMLKAAKLVEDQCDAVDVNLGCPQGIAKRGRYGAFLMEELELLKEIVSTLVKGLKVPVTCKTRIYKDFDRSIKLCETLVQAGASLLTIHGRTREEKGHDIKDADWHMLARIKKHFEGRVPIIANGGVGTYDDAERCLLFTNCDGVMSSEAILENPSLFMPNSNVNQIDMAIEYLHFCLKYNEGSIKIVRNHLMKFLYRYFCIHEDIRNTTAVTKDILGLIEICQQLKVVVGTKDKEYNKYWYLRYRERDSNRIADDCENGENCYGNRRHFVPDKVCVKDSWFVTTNSDTDASSLFDGLSMFDNEEE